MKPPPPSLYDRDDYYLDNQNASRFSPVFDGLLYVFEYLRVLGFVMRIGSRRGKALDVGGGDGKFLFLLGKFGFKGVGTTASSIASRVAAARFGITLHVSEGLNEVADAGPFEVITYWHVFEHLREPASHSRRWRELITPEGTVMIEVPNIASLGAKICYRSWLGSDDVHHINHQSPEQLFATLKEAGFAPVHVGYFSAKFTYTFLWSALLGRLFPKTYDFNRIMSLLKQPFGNLKTAPVATINGFASIFYLAPVIVPLSIAGLLTRRGEVLRVFARRVAVPQLE